MVTETIPEWYVYIPYATKSMGMHLRNPMFEAFEKHLEDNNQYLTMKLAYSFTMQQSKEAAAKKRFIFLESFFYPARQAALCEDAKRERNSDFERPFQANLKKTINSINKIAQDKMIIDRKKTRRFKYYFVNLQAKPFENFALDNNVYYRLDKLLHFYTFRQSSLDLQAIKRILYFELAELDKCYNFLLHYCDWHLPDEEDKKEGEIKKMVLKILQDKDIPDVIDKELHKEFYLKTKDPVENEQDSMNFINTLKEERSFLFK